MAFPGYYMKHLHCFSGYTRGTVIAAWFSFTASFRLFPAPAALASRLILLLIRTVPVFVYGLMWIRVTGPGAACGCADTDSVQCGPPGQAVPHRYRRYSSGAVPRMPGHGGFCRAIYPLGCPAPIGNSLRSGYPVPVRYQSA